MNQSTPFQSNTEAVSFFIGGKQHRVPVGHPSYPAILSALTRGASAAEILELQETPKIPSIFEEKEGRLFFEGQKLPAALETKVRSLVAQRLDIQFFLNFWNRLKLNNRRNAVQQLFSFLEYKELPITPEGYFIAWKGLQADYFSIRGNLETRVLSGEVNSKGQIRNLVGCEISVNPQDVSDDPNVHCGPGIHAGSLDYAKGWAQGKVVAVLIDPADVISVPNDCNCQKLRTWRYKVIAEYGGEIKAAAADEKGKEILSKDSAEFAARKERVKNYLEKKKKEGVGVVSARAIQSSFSPECPSVAEIRTILGQLGVTVNAEGGAVLSW